MSVANGHSRSNGTQGAHQIDKISERIAVEDKAPLVKKATRSMKKLETAIAAAWLGSTAFKELARTFENRLEAQLPLQPPPQFSPQSSSQFSPQPPGQVPHNRRHIYTDEVAFRGPLNRKDPWRPK